MNVVKSSDDARSVARAVVVQALGSGVAPFVPVPFVDGWVLARLLQSIAKAVLIRRGATATEALSKARGIVLGYVTAGKTGVRTRAAVAAARFVMRKLALVLDVKRSHDAIGEAVAFALALDVAAELGFTESVPPSELGAVIHAAICGSSSSPVSALATAAKRALTGPGLGSRRSRLAEAIGAEADASRARLDASLRAAFGAPAGRR
jgi:hypothetical protein